ncbi:MAG: Tfp pilus assembly protein PilF [Parvicella sp.]|jgi:Tfp pilus assembly protein PilF
MKNIIFLLPIVLILSCNNETKDKEQKDPPKHSYSKYLELTIENVENEKFKEAEAIIKEARKYYPDSISEQELNEAIYSIQITGDKLRGQEIDKALDSRIGEDNRAISEIADSLANAVDLGDFDPNDI